MNIRSATAAAEASPSTSRGGRLRTRILGISPEEASFARRGFPPAAPATQARLEGIGHTFIQGYLAALARTDPTVLGGDLDGAPLAERGFAYEGASAALALLDLLTPWPTRHLQALLEGPGAVHSYMVHLGAGWAMARVPWGLFHLGRLAPLLRWLALDGYGFHQGYFHWRRYITAAHEPRLPPGYACRAFDQGLGRSLWFVTGADPVKIVATIGGFPAERRSDLWSGVGLAAAYAGGVAPETLDALARHGEAFHPELAQGAAFAARARERAGNPTPHTEAACRRLTGCPASSAAHLTEHALHNLPIDADVPAYEVWRRRIQAPFTEKFS